MRVDLTDGDALARLLDTVRPDAVVHSAAIGRSNRCEEHPDEARRVNALLPGLVARLCRDRGLRLVSLSTDLVFAGDRPFLRESDPPGPLSVYGRTKLAGEEAVLAAMPRAAVLRLSLVLGRGHGGRGTSTETIAWALAEGRPLRLYTDEYRTPVDPESVADAIERLLHTSGAGRYHLGGDERVSRHELGRRVARALGLPEAALQAALTSDHPGPEPRARDVSLDSTRARTELGFRPRPLDEAIRQGRRAPE